MGHDGKPGDEENRRSQGYLGFSVPPVRMRHLRESSRKCDAPSEALPVPLEAKTGIHNDDNPLRAEETIRERLRRLQEKIILQRRKEYSPDPRSRLAADTVLFEED